MVNYDISKDLNIFLLLPNRATALTLKHNLRIILGWKPEKFKTIEARKKVEYTCTKKVCGAGKGYELGRIVVRAHASHAEGLRFEPDSMP